MVKEDKIVYVVSGFMRTGTSMMMKALEAGGIKAEYKQSRDVMKNHFADENYDPNIGGLYELEKSDYMEFGFPEKYVGKLIKALNSGVPRMAVMPGIRVVFMMRDQEEIRQSYEAFFNAPLKNMDHYKKNMIDIIKRIKNRKDLLSIHVFNYREVVEDPLKFFIQLKQAGWPINPENSAAVINKKYCRFKKENLVEGI